MNNEAILKLATVRRVLSSSRYRTVRTRKRLEAGAFKPLFNSRTSGERIATREKQVDYAKLSTPLREVQQGES